MVSVRFLGLIRLKIKLSTIQLTAKRLDELLLKINEQFNELNIEDLKKSVILVNGKNIIHLKVFKTKLSDGDQVEIMSPVGGG